MPEFNQRPMKSLGLLALGVLCAVSAPAFVYENDWEFQSDGYFDTDGQLDLVIVDKATGNYRVGFQLTPGNYTWAAARASGIQNVMGFTVGRLTATNRDALAFTSPDANRINILDATNTSTAGLPISVFIPSVGPNLVAAIDIGGAGNITNDDLYVCSVYNSGSNLRETLLRNDGANFTVMSDTGLAPADSYRTRANPVLLKTNSFPRLAVFSRNTSPGYDTFQTYTMTSGVPVLAFSQLTLGGAVSFDYIHGQFATTNAYTQFLLYSSNYTSVWAYQVTEPSPGAYAFPLTNILYFTNYVERMFALPSTNGSRLLVIYRGGTSAVVYDWDGVTNRAVARQQISAAAGEHFTGFGIMGKNGFMAYSAPLGQNTSCHFKPWNWNGSAYVAGTAGDLPRLNAFTGSGNVLQFRYEPFVTNTPILLRLNNAGDWTSQPLTSGLPATLTVKSETFTSATQGLVNPVSISVGQVHPLAQFGLANQYSNMISLFSFQPPIGDSISEVTISPTPGAYSAAIRLGFTASDPTHSIYFRVGSSPWALFTGQTNFLFTNAVVQYYGQPPAGNAKSVVKSANYSFTAAPDMIDSDGDGVPDFVEAAYGLNPNGGADSDGDGFTDLEELIHGTNPGSTNSFPTTNSWPVNRLHIDDQAVFDLISTPFPWCGFSNRSTLIATGATLRAYDMSGGFLGSTEATNQARPFARLTNIVVDPSKRLISVSTDLHYNILTTNTDKTVGREMIGLFGVPALSAMAGAYTNSGSNTFWEATNWVRLASNSWNSLKRGTVTNTLSVTNTLTALLFEQTTAILLGSRSNLWWNNLTLFPFRVADVARTNPPAGSLLSLETNLDAAHPGYKLQTTLATISNVVATATSVTVSNLLKLAQEIYRIDSRYNNDYPATFASPVDELRYFLWNGKFDSNYQARTTLSGLYSSASNGVIAVLSAVQPRPMTNLSLLVRADAFGSTRRLLDQADHPSAAAYALLDSSGLPFSFPDNFQLLPGSRVSAYGYTDVTSPSPTNPALEVVAISLASVPIANDLDTDGNLLIDSWENKFFGHLGNDPFADSDGDTFSNLQEMFDGSDPTDLRGIPAKPLVSFRAPSIEIVADGGMLRLRFDWPSDYLSLVAFRVRSTPTLTTSFSDVGTATPEPVPGVANRWQISVSRPVAPFYFYEFGVELKAR